MGTTLKPQINGNTLKSQVHQGNMVQRERFKRPPQKAFLLSPAPAREKGMFGRRWNLVYLQKQILHRKTTRSTEPLQSLVISPVNFSIFLIKQKWLTTFLQVLEIIFTGNLTLFLSINLWITRKISVIQVLQIFFTRGYYMCNNTSGYA